MAYIRRYLAGQQATTVVIAEGAITSDKISDKAVITRTIDDGAVGSQQILDEAILSEDIKDGEIKTSNLMDGSVTGPKILAGVVTRDKLSADLLPSTRPFTPGVSSDEIIAGAIIASKIAAGAVESAAIKSPAITSDKIFSKAVNRAAIDDLAVGADQIEAAVVDVTKLKNLSVNESKIIDGSCTEDKIGALAVSTGKIQDRNVTGVKIALLGVIAENLGPNAVTEPKLQSDALSLRHKESLDIRLGDLGEDFAGSEISNRWRRLIDDSGYAYWAGISDGLSLGTAPTDGKAVILDWESKGFKPDGRKISQTFFLPASGVSKTYSLKELGLVYVFNKSAYILFTAEDAAGAVPNWFARCKESGVETSQDTGVAVGDDVQALTIEYISDTEVNFYIDGTLVATIATNIPSGTLLDPYMAITARSNAARVLLVQSMSLLRERPDFV